MKRIVWLHLLLLFAALPAAAHEVGEAAGEGPHDFHELWRTWGFEPGSIIGIVLVGGLYAVGVWKMWRANNAGRGIKRWEVGCFAAGWFTLVVALISPLHPWGQVLFSAHMVQHELLMLVAAPLMVLGQPMSAMLRALPSGVAHSLGRFSNTPGWSGMWGTISNPFSAWLIHVIVLWGWHAPALLGATLHNEWVHAAQHVSFLGSALLFWWALIHGRRHAAAYGVGVLYLFTTALHSGLLGALLTFSRTVWYPHYAETTGDWGFTALQDQQLGGLIMWVPACTVYIFAGLAMFAAWLRASERRVVRREMRSVVPEVVP